jgi:hypothetical protein
MKGSILLSLTWFCAMAAASAPALEPEALRGMVIVEGEEGRGSGFLVNMGDRVCVVTNAHVIQGSKKVTFKTLDNKALAIGLLEIAENADLVRAEIKDASAVLKMVTKLEERLKIGDEVVVAGNAEGEGVVREISGKVVGVGPDRIEVDAPFVPGNSGSPILLKSSGEVIGVATYLKIPPFHGFTGDQADAGEPVFRLNEVRRFGYRLDTVDRWVRSTHPEGLLGEGSRLADLDALDQAVFSIVVAGTEALLESGSAAFLDEDQKAKARFMDLSAAIDEFVTAYRAAKDPKDREKPFNQFFERLREITSLESPEDVKDKYSGYHAILYRERFESRKGLHEWLDYMKDRAAGKDWVIEVPEFDWTDEQSLDVSKINLPLEHQVDWEYEPDRRHRVTYPGSAKPRSIRNLHWVITFPSGKEEVMPLTQTNLRVSTITNGKYRVRAEHRVGDVHQKVSNEVSFTVNDLPPPNAIVDFAAAAPIEHSGGAETPIDWAELASRITEGGIAMSPVLGIDPITQKIRDIPGAGGILVGLDLFLAPHANYSETVAALRPIFLEKGGQKSGTYWGSSRVEGNFQLLANPGYAIGKLSVRFDGFAIRSVKVRFDRLRGLALDKADSYETEWIGEAGEAKEFSVETNGRLPVGIVGKHYNKIYGLSFVCLTDQSTKPPVIEAPPIPEVFSSAEEILNQIPIHLIDLTKRPETRKEAIVRINEFLAKNVKGKPFEGEVRVEMARPVDDKSPNKFRIKVPDTRITANDPIRTRLWVYFLADDVPETPPSVGSEVRVTGQIGRCDVTGDKHLIINNDIQKSKMIPPTAAAKPEPKPDPSIGGER